MLINKKTLEYLAELSRIELEALMPESGRGPDQSIGKKLLKDLQKILDYFEELKEVNTENVNGVKPVAGGMTKVNVFREDDSTRINADKNADLRGKLVEAFPKKEKDFLKVPAVFA